MTTNTASQWFDRFRDTPFPVTALPESIANYVTHESSRFGEDPSVVATTSLAQLAGVAAEDHTDGAPVSLGFNLIVASASPSVAERNTVLEHCQREQIKAAALLDKKRIAELLKAPVHQLPDCIPGSVDPRNISEARLEAIHAAQKPIFWVEAGGSREILAGYAGSADTTLLLTYTGSDVIERLMAPRPDRETRRLQDLMGRLAGGGAVDLKARGGLIQPRMALVALTSPETLRQAIVNRRPWMQSLIKNSVVITAQPGTATHIQRHDPAIWSHWVSSLLSSRRRREGLQPHPSFYHELQKWEQRLQELRQATPPNLLSHFAPFANLPFKLACLFLSLEYRGGFSDGESARGAISGSEWMMAQSLLTAADAYAAEAEVAQSKARDEMLEKISISGPIDFWRLCRRFHDQNKEIHQSTLEALMQENRVRLNSEGKLEAA